MKASPFFPLTFSSLLLALSISVLAQSGQYTVQVDSVTAQDAAEGKVQALKSQGQNAYWLKSNVPGQGLRYRVRIGRFPTRVAAQNFGARIKQQGLTSDFFVALFEGASSSFGEPVKKPAPPPVLSAAPKTAPTETKAAENKTDENKAALPRHNGSAKSNRSRLPPQCQMLRRRIAARTRQSIISLRQER